MTSKFKNQFYDLLITREIAQPDEIVGCSLEEIDTIKIRQSVQRLPLAYCEFLAVAGKQAGNLWRGCKYNFKYLHDLKSEVMKLMVAYGKPLKLPEDAFVILIEEGINFYWILTANEDDNPPVYGYAPEPYFYGIHTKKLSDFLLYIY